VDRRAWVPHPRSGVVERRTLVATLLASAASVVTVVAPPGYGKTTLLAQWAERVGDRACWISCEEADNDPTALWAVILGVLARLAPPGWLAPDLLAKSGGDLAAVPALMSSLSGIGGRVLLVLDQAESIQSRDCRVALAELVVRLPPGWQVAFGSRGPLPLPMSRLRMQGSLLQIGADELAMSPSEARQLFSGAGVVVADEDARQLLSQTEGWAAGLYLATLALRSGTPTSGFTFTGDDRLMRDYLRSEFLDHMSEGQQEFLVRTSILDQLTGPLCDAVLGGTASARILEELEERNLLVVPLDRRGEWYRYHHLLRDLLQSELRNRDPDEVREGHRRAAAWFVANGPVDAAIRHAQAAGDVDRVAELVLDEMQPTWVSGRVETVRGWMEWLAAHPPTRYYTAIAAHGSLIFGLLGRTGDSERWGAVAESRVAESVLPDGSTEAATVAYMRAIQARAGPAAWRRDALAAVAGLAADSPYRATMCHTVGLSHLVEGDLDRAEVAFVEAQDLAVALSAPPLEALVLAERHLVARARGDDVSSHECLRDALEIVRSGHLDSYWTSALVLAAAARSSAEHGDMLAAHRHVRQAAQLRPLLTHVLPVVSVQTLLELARAYVELVDPAGARAALQQASGIMLRRPALGDLQAQAGALRGRLGQITDSPPAGPSSLTAAELRLLPLLPTHLSFPQIADQLSLSRHTVKTQVTSLYRKLGVSSRREAVDRLVQLGLAS
jgi:LuxR family transcriptional regulator, maltose regulon positive regulatory protein